MQQAFNRPTSRNKEKKFGYFQQHGVLILNKPSGPTSTKCLEKIKKKLAQKKIGHAGTLDPMAEGILVVLLGEGTKLEPYLSSNFKQYKGCARLGQETDTYDIGGRVLEKHSLENIDSEMIKSEIKSWSLLKEQDIPEYSASKHKGKPLYELKRKGLEVPRKKKSIEIQQARVLDIDLPFVNFWVKCSKGTYIRSLAHSLGMRLGCGAVLTKLIREESYPFKLDKAQDLESILSEPEEFPNKILSIPEALPDWPRVHLTQDQMDRVKNGKWLKNREIPELATDKEGQNALLLSPEGVPVALTKSTQSDNFLNWSILRGFSSLS